MLPLQQAHEVKYSILEYLKATFSFKDKGVQESFYQFLRNPEEGIFKGPYISLKLPFVTSSEENTTIPLEIKPNFLPYDHQFKSFRRLTTRNEQPPRSTIITTGTSSGKTECFLYPILDYAYKERDRQGIKVIILYPMNALATDQAKRLAETINGDDRLKDKITVGLFIGEGKEKKKYPAQMGESHVIENKQAIVSSPPDILLTNFKMLDYALMRGEYHNVWSHNLQDTSLLQFIVLDELHTYDGAQGTDVANLIRRLKLKLGIKKGQLCAVGTSATIGSGVESKKQLVEYAEKVFGEKFDDESLISEKRVHISDFFGVTNKLEKYVPRQLGLLDSRLTNDESYTKYINRQKRLWQIPETTQDTELGNELKKLELVKDLLTVTSRGIISLQDLIYTLADINAEFRSVEEWDAKNNFSPREEIIHSLLALISEAKTGVIRKSPFLFLQVQLWIRELSGVQRVLGEKPRFIWREDIDGENRQLSMPSYFCRECGSSGWLGVKDDNKNHFSQDTNQVSQYFFQNHKNVYFINTQNHKHIQEYIPDTTIDSYLDIQNLNLSSDGHKNTFKIHAVRKLKDSRSRHICPECNTENTLGIIGTRITTLSSVAVSQVLSSDLDFRPEKFRKVLAFTNSVQDAAHQAGFLEARNYRFTFRSSLQKVINELNSPISLDQLQEEFIKYWKTHSDEIDSNSEAYYYRFFPSDYRGKINLALDFREKKQLTNEFTKEFDYRISWEVISEFGYNSRIGRTLEKSGASGVKIDNSQLEKVFPLLKDWLNDNNLLSINEENLVPFLNGILHRIRTRGGIDHTYFSKFRQGKYELRELNWYQDSRHFLNKNFGKRTRLPKIITNVAHHKGMMDTTYTSTQSWYKNYFVKSFQLVPNYSAIINEFYSKVLEVLNDIGVLNKVTIGNNSNYAIDPKVLIVENRVKIHECDKCYSQFYVADSDQITQYTKCLEYTCDSGTYKPLEISTPNYYQLVYNRNRSPRIYATEHTGILERRDRENKEIDFKERPKFNSLNSLVATSTLEMGIDIGSLNTVLNNSIPPLTSNFLQRVGRAGRSSGSALVVNFAKSKPHDLYYYQKPSDMMEGEVTTPGCFLEAKDILFRHFFAFCIDKWTSIDPNNNTIPMTIRTLNLSMSDLMAPEMFVNRIINYIKNNETSLLSEFCNFYEGDLDDNRVLDLLGSYISEERFYERFRRVFSNLKNEYQSIALKRKEISEFIINNNLPETDEERKELEREKRALWGLKRLIDKRILLEHLTNVGLLPNYAFPETGVTLNAWVKSVPSKGSKNTVITDQQFEIIRPAVSAIRELAPDNYFYSQGFKLHISGLNTHDWGDDGTLLKKRFCSNCDNLEIAVTSTTSECPKCGDHSWSSQQNVHTFVKLTGVKSVNNVSDSTLDDSSNDRDSSHYTISKHIQFDGASSQGSWGMKDIPFGIEYVKNVKITIVNLGISSTISANNTTINRIENTPHHGFITCKHCGKSTSEAPRDNNSFHYAYCKFKNEQYKGVSDTIFEEVFLFREVSTEAIKVLIPVQNFEAEATVNMFKAGLELGLKKYYKGNPQHLNIMSYLEYNPQNSRFDRFLVIYDTISGGTGYLEKLFNTMEFTKVLSLAYHEIKECTCQTLNKDGCYRCIYTYSNQYIHHELSRKKAEKLFKKIIDRTDQWELYTWSLNKLSAQGQIEESELEYRFIESLKKYCSKNEGFEFREDVSDGVVNYIISLLRDQHKFIYLIRPQFDLGASQGVSVYTRADFYITLTAVFQNEELVQDWWHNSSFKDIAVYLDGYVYHATKDNPRFLGDLQKRQAINRSGNKITWTLTWDDLERFDSSLVNQRRDTFELNAKYRSNRDSLKGIPYYRSYVSELTETSSSLERLIWFLKNPLIDNMVDKKISWYIMSFQDKFGHPSCNNDEIDKLMGPNGIILDTQVATNRTTGNFYVFPDFRINYQNLLIAKTAVKAADLECISKVYVSSKIDELEKETWEFFWQMYNLTQFNSEVKIDNFENSDDDEDKYKCLENYDESLWELLKELIDNNIDFDREGGFFLQTTDGFAEAMLGFEKFKIAIRPLSEEESLIFEEAGYKVINDLLDFNINLIR